MKLADKYSFDPFSAFDAIEKEFSFVRDNLAEIQEKVSGVLENGGLMPPPIATHWEYDVTDPVFFSDNMYQLEEAGRVHKRWVGPSPALDWRLRLRRDLSYVVEIDIVDSFPRTVFHTAVDGVDVENKMTRQTLRFRAIPNEAAFARGDGLHLCVRIDEDRLRVPEDGSADNRTLAFSIGAIRVHSDNV